MDSSPCINQMGALMRGTISWPWVVQQWSAYMYVSIVAVLAAGLVTDYPPGIPTQPGRFILG
jgi:hypothetical protein